MAWFLRNGTEWTGIVHDEAGKPWASVPRKCTRCGGIGWIDGFKHVEGGKCFDCCGSGWHKNGPEHARLFSADKLAKLNATQEKARAKKAAEHATAVAQRAAEVDARRLAFLDTFHSEIAFLEAVATTPDGVKPGFLGDMLLRARNDAEWTEAQVAAIHKIMAQRAEEKAKAVASQFIGAVGQRIETTATVERETSFFHEGWGFAGPEEVFVTTLRDQDGNALVVMSPSFREVVGSVIKLKGTVKGHKEFRDEKQTTLNRVKVIETVTFAPSGETTVG
jgi:hypothetical protein